MSINPAQQEAVGITDFVRSLRRGKWIILVTILICVAAAWIYTARLPRLYTATARIDVDLKGKSALKLDSDVADVTSVAKLDTQLGILRSQSVSWDVIKRLHLYSDPRFMGAIPYPVDTDPDKLSVTSQSILISRFLSNLVVEYERGTEIADIMYRSTDPALAASIANEIADSYEDRNFQTRYATTRKASDWLKGQLATLKHDVEAAQSKFSDFQKENSLLGTDETHNSGNSEKLSQLNSAFASAEIQRILKENLYVATESADPDQVSPSGTFPALTALRTQKANLDGQYASLNAKYGPSYPRNVQLQKEIEQVQSAIDRELNRARQQIKTDFILAKHNEEGLAAAVEQQKQQIFALNEKVLQYTLLQRQVTSSRDLYEDLLRKLQEAGITSGLSADSIAVIDPALPPFVPSFPRKRVNIEVGFLIGLILGISLALAYEFINSSIRTVEDIRAYSGLPTLGLVPHVQMKSQQALRVKEGDSRSIPAPRRAKITDDPNSKFAEAYRNVRSSILLSSAGAPPKMIVVSSSWPKEGKSTTAVNLATVLAQSGKRVLLVDGDLRRPSLHTSYDLSLAKQSGLSEILSGMDLPGLYVRPDPSIPNLEVIFAGRIPPSPSELLMSAEMGRLVAKWREEYDFVVFDTAPFLAVSDASYLISVADAVVIVVRAGSTRRKALRVLRDHILGVRGKIAGVLLNDVKASTEAYYDYYGGTRKDYDVYYSKPGA